MLETYPLPEPEKVTVDADTSDPFRKSLQDTPPLPKHQRPLCGARTRGPEEPANVAPSPARPAAVIMAA